MSDFRELKVWQLSKDLAVDIYKLSNQEVIKNDFSFRDQIRRSAVSIPSNIAEGEGLDTDRQSIRHLHIARGSLAELRTQLIISHEIGYIGNDISRAFDEECDKIGAMLTRLIQYRSR